jgi:hypothetical protein
VPGHESGAIQGNRKILLAAIAAKAIHYLLTKFSEGKWAIEYTSARGFENKFSIAKIAVA